ncbi:MAG: dihydrolipoamide dehydrogenase [Nitrososphaeraceae archaeon]|nr:dihydrolipoamide dehydrogenase [Nitrososphaeraceae archaeon]
MQKFDLIVIGSGSGLDVANAASQQGLKVAIVEKGKLGGTCLNRGCIPSKMIIHSADLVEKIKQAEIFGIKINDGGLSIDFQKIISRVNETIDSHSLEIKNGLERSENPRLFTRECKFVGDKTFVLMEGNEAKEEIISADKILIASGARPIIPEIKGLKVSGYITSDEALRILHQPRVLTFIGGGYIACELAHFFGSLGTEINIIQKSNSLLPHEDEETSKKFTEIFSKKFKVYLGYNTESVSRDNGNEFHVIARNSNGKSIEVESDQLLVSVGRGPNSDILDVTKTGVQLNERGFVKVDEYLETSVKGIFAIGDAVGKYQFKHNSNNEAKYAYHNILNPDKKIVVDYFAMPHAIFSSPQIAGVGFTEQELRTMKQYDYQKSVFPYINTAMGKTIEDKDGFVKFLVDKKDRKILGCHIMGSDASILIHEVLVAMKAGDGKIDSINKTIHIHPALSEVVARAASSI